MIKQMTPLRQRMIDDMNFRNMSPSAQKVGLCRWDKEWVSIDVKWPTGALSSPIHTRD